MASVDLNASGAVDIRANLTSSFQWGPNDDYEIRASGSGPANLSLQVCMDTRFGSLIVASLG